ncbi:hypothetical protein HY632_02085 [Candidatus Uhrbacteria bacterium]|nr:hypothetical protein [Candidatus Uhrbacteria bacterium]
MTHPRRGWFCSLGIGVLAVLAFAGAGCRNPFQEDSAKVLQTAYTRAVDAEQARYDMHGVMRVVPTKENGDPSFGDLTITLDASAADGGRGAAAMSEGTQKVVVAASALGTFTAKIDMRWVGEKAYVRLGELSVVVDQKAVGGDAEQVRRSQRELDAGIGAVKGMLGGKWIAIDLRALATLASTIDSSVPAPTLPTGAALDALDAKLRAIVKANPLLVLRERVGTEKVDGVRAYHYRVGINRSAILPLLEAIAPELQISDADLVEARTALADPQVIQAIDRMTGDVWIGKQSKDFVRASLAIDSDQLVPEEARKDGRVTGSLDMRFREWGKPIQVEVPTDAVTIEELLGGLLP